MTPARSFVPRTALAAFAALILLQFPTDAFAFRIIASASGSAGIAQPGCCWDYDGGYESSTAPLTAALTTNVVEAGASRLVTLTRTDLSGAKTQIAFGSEAHASMLDFGTRATVDVTNWDENYTGGTIGAYSSAVVEQSFGTVSPVDLYVRPVFEVEGSISHSQGFTSSLTFNMVAVLPGDTAQSDNILLDIDIDTGLPGTQLIDQVLTGPEMFVAAGQRLWASLRLSTEVQGSVNGIAEGDHFAQADASHTIRLLGFETFSDAAYSIPVDVEFTSDSGEVFSTVPEPGTALMLGLGLAGLARTRTTWRRAATGDAQKR